MFLACCFRSQSKKNGNVSDDEESYAPTKSLLSSPKISSIHHVQTYSSAIHKNIKNISTCKTPTISQENHLSPEQLLKLEKEKEELKIHRRSFPNDFISDHKITSSPCKKESKNQIGYPTSTNISTIQSLKLHQLIPKDVSRMFASAEDLEGSLLSVSSAHQSLQISNKSLVSSSISSMGKVSATSLLPTHQNSSTTALINNSSKEKETSASNEEKQKTIKIEELKENHNKREQVIRKIREESVRNIEALKIQNKIELEKVKDFHVAKLREDKEKHIENVKTANIDTMNEANETISQLNKQIIQEKGKTFTELQEKSKTLEEGLGMKNEQLNTSLKEIEQREIAWQKERADVLNEVQRLKAETTKMVKILAMEYKGEPWGEDKRRSLSQEVYSLQLVVEMRTGEVRNFRDQLARATQQLERAEIDKEKLKKAASRMEDLEEQLKIKKEKEKQLFDEKIQLERSMKNTSKNAERISQNMEALQWRIRNSFDLPVDNLQPVTCEQPYIDHPSLLADEKSSDTDTEHVESAKEADHLNDDIVKSLSFSDVFVSTRILHEMNEIILSSPETKQRVCDTASAGSEDSQVNDWNGDAESLDEGVGDISSECEHGANDHLGDQNDKNQNESDNCDDHMDKCSSSKGPEKERIASIF